jgi:cytochrome b6-f complex iron-sulfur subunit
MAEKKKMSVAEILAAARASDGSAGAVSPPANSPPAKASNEGHLSGGEPAGAEIAGSESPVEQSAPAMAAGQKPAAKKPAVTQPAAASSGSRPSVAEILAMARKKQEEGGAASPTPAKPAAAKGPATKKAGLATEKPVAEKAAAKKPVGKPVAGPKTGVQRDTASILAAARAATKPGPVSKAEAPVRPAVKPKPAGKSQGAAVQGAAAQAAAAPAAKIAPPRPVRPAAAVKKADVEDRRSFLQIAMGSFMAMGFTALSVTGGLFSLGLARFFFPNVLAEPPSRFKVGFREGFPAGKVETKFVAQYGVWVVNGEFQGQQQIYALKTVCTHLGCTPNWLEAEQKFKCPCHGSGFYKDGINFEGPAPRPLERYAIRIADDGQLEVDKSRSFQEELGQWEDAESYVTA